MVQVSRNGEAMKKIAVFDIEATNWTDFACLGFFDGEDYKVYWGIEHFLEDLLTPKYKGWTIYAHFGGKYDFRFLIPALVDSGDYTLKFIERASKILSIKITHIKTKSTWKLADSFFLLPMSLRSLGENFQIENMKGVFDVESCKTAKDFATDEAQAYLRSDCFGLYEILDKFSRWGLNDGKLKLTLPSQALYVFTTKYLDRKLRGLNEVQEDFIRKTYFGGRVEIFKTYGENLFYYDVNSLYPAMMLNDMPVGRDLRVTRYYPDKIGFYNIKATIKDLHIPPIPTLINGKLFFPTGEGEFYVSSADIKLLISLGIDFEVKDGIIFEDKAPIFKGFINDMWDIRQKTSRGTMENTIAKLIMNSTYGKFGQKREGEELIFSPTPVIGARPFDERFGLYLKDTESRNPYILPHIASYITSLARVHLYKLMQKAGLENVWYCDTDSIITSTKMETGEGLGELKLEYEVLEGVFLQPKAYAMKIKDKDGIKEVVKVKGMKELKLGLSDFIISIKEKRVNNIKSEYKNILGFRETLRRTKSLKIVRKSIYKQLNSFYDKREVLGIETKPLSIAKINSNNS